MFQSMLLNKSTDYHCVLDVMNNQTVAFIGQKGGTWKNMGQEGNGRVKIGRETG